MYSVVSNSKGWLECGVYRSPLVAQWIMDLALSLLQLWLLQWYDSISGLETSACRGCGPPQISICASRFKECQLFRV